MKTTLTREIVIRAIHHLENSALTPEANRNLYGRCYGRHGHDYHVLVTVRGSVDPMSGWVISRDELDHILQREIIAPYDGADLNLHFPNTACEAVAFEFYQRLRPFLPGLVKIGVQETRKNYFEYPSAALP